MGNTFFYQQVRADVSKITWKEIFSGTFQKHSKQEMEYAMTAGTSLNTATEADMLQRWQRPWLWWRVFLTGIILTVLIIALTWVTGAQAFFALLLVLVPLVVPVVLMVFFWELNIPKNISIYELLGYMMFGTIISFVISLVASYFIGSPAGAFEASVAAFGEEPGKLVASAVFIHMIGKKKRLYGLTGLVVGAAVGAGFSGFESVMYAIFVAPTLSNILLRFVFALGGHVLFCAPYAAALALSSPEGGLKATCFVNKDFLLTFGVSVASHFFWNAALPDPYFIKEIVITVILWWQTLVIVKKCLYQAVLRGNYRSGEAVCGIPPFDRSIAEQRMPAGAAATVPRPMGSVSYASAGICIVGVSGILKGAVWRGDSGVLSIGRGTENGFRFPQQTPGVSRQHCSIQKTSQGWTVRDLNSSNGTFMGDGRRLAPGIDVVLKEGDVICIGGSNQAFRVSFPVR